LIDGINIIINNKNFTYASHEAGFADSAHMSRTFKEMFGINLQDIFKNSRSVQVKICNY
jgi:AraC-like DNA-binding protein